MTITKFNIINSQGDFFELEHAYVSNEGILTVWANPYSEDLASELHTVDIINESMVSYFKSEGYSVLHNGVFK